MAVVAEERVAVAQPAQQEQGRIIRYPDGGVTALVAAQEVAFSAINKVQQFMVAEVKLRVTAL